ncbi:MAG: DUF3604 domain-containing protein [Candidatus Eisenbacteria bacterium]
MEAEGLRPMPAVFRILLPALAAMFAFLPRPVPAGEVPFPATAVRDDHDADAAVDSTGRPWVVWIQTTADTSAGGPWDRVLAACWNGASWDTTLVSESVGDYFNPRVTGLSEGAWVAWVAIETDDADILARRLGVGGGGSFPVAAGPEREFAPALCTDGNGDAWIAWQSWSGASFDVHIGRIEDDSLAETGIVADGPANDRDPSLAPAEDGSIWVAWSSIRSRHSEICLRRLSGGTWDDPIQVTSAIKTWSLYPSVAVDGDGNVWVAYYHRNRPWKYYEEPAPEGTDLGSIFLLRWDGEHVSIPLGTEWNTGRVPRPAMEDVGYVLPESPIRVYGLRPRLLTDGQGRPWILSKLNGYLDHEGVRCMYWGIFGVFYDGASWSSVPEVIAPRNGHFWDEPAAAFDPEGRLWVAWVEDRRATEPIRTVNNILGPDADIRVDTFAAVPGSGAPHEVIEPTAPPPWDEGEPRTVPRYEISTDAVTYRVYWGENHRHSCELSYDGIWDYPFEDTYLHTYERIGYDWIAPSDHVEWWSPLAWRLVAKWTDLFHVPGDFVTFPGYERAGRTAAPAGKGDQNALYLRSSEFRSMDARIGPTVRWLDLYHGVEGKDVLFIPHHPVDRTGYTMWEGLVESDTLPAPLRLVEIFQTTRGSSEYPGCPMESWKPHVGPDTGWVSLALASGMRLGIGAGGDHNPGNGFTAVLAEEPTRESIFEALRARRCYGTTFSRKMFVDFRVGGHLMGEEFETSESPTIEYRVTGTEPLTRVVIVKNGDPEWYVAVPEGASDSASFVDPDGAVPGTTSWYYLRAEEGDSGIAWTSPVWVDFTVPTAVSERGGNGRTSPEDGSPGPHPFFPAFGPYHVALPAGAGPARVYALSGRLVRALPVDDGGAASWDGRDDRGRELPPGVYFLRSEPSPGTPAFRRKIILVR